MVIGDNIMMFCACCVLTPYLSVACELWRAALLHSTRADVVFNQRLASQVAQLPAQLAAKATMHAGSKGNFESPALAGCCCLC
jgi:hypothetical protein